MAKVNNPHDKLFKKTFSDISVTRDFLNNYLPEEVLGIIDLETIAPLKDSFINHELEEAFSDLLFGVNIAGEASYIYFLFEHKSYQTKNIAIQLLHYMTEIWDQKLTMEMKETLPLIIPIVIYHGRNEWTKGKRIKELIEGFNDFTTTVKSYVPDYDYLLVDLSQFSEMDIRGEIKLRVFLDLFSHIFTSDNRKFELVLTKHVQELLEVHDKQPDITEYFKTYIKYVLSVREDVTVDKAHEIVRKISTRGGSIMATAADELRREGREEGRKEERKEVAKNLLMQNIDEDQIMKATKITEEELEEIKKSIV